MKKFLALFLFLGIMVLLVSQDAKAQVGSVGSLYVDPAVSTFVPNTPFQVVLGVNVGSSNKVNVVEATIRLDGGLVLSDCTAGNGFQGVIGRPACSTTNSETIIRVQATSAEGPSGAVSFARITVQPTTSGSVRFLSSSIIVKNSAGASVPYVLTNTMDGSFSPQSPTIVQISNTQTPSAPTVTSTPVSTITPILPSPTTALAYCEIPENNGTVCCFMPTCPVGSACILVCKTGICISNTCVQVTSTPIPPTSTQVPGCTKPAKSKGNANADCFVDNADYQIWVSEFLKTVTTKNADFDQNSKVDLIDYEIWRRNTSFPL